MRESRRLLSADQSVGGGYPEARSFARAVAAVVAGGEGSPDLRVLETVLDALDVLVYVSDMHTHEVLFVSRHGIDIWGAPEGRRCFEYLQAQQASPCAFCTNDRLVDADGKPTGVLVWEFQNTVTQRWYQCHDQAIPWIDGRIVRIEAAIDITDRKHAEAALREARQQAEALARIDPLTAVPNRRAFYERMARALDGPRRAHSSICLAMVDVDHFKRFNDTHGHVFGDEVLVSLCRYFNAHLRPSDEVFRFGGEEFVVVLPDTDAEGALRLADRLREGIARMPLRHDGRVEHVTCSIGIAAWAGDADIDAWLARADRAMYAAKAAGRNCCVLQDHDAGAGVVASPAVK